MNAQTTSPSRGAGFHARLLASYAEGPPIRRDRCFHGLVLLLQLVTLALLAVPIGNQRSSALPRSTAPSENSVLVHFEVKETPRPSVATPPAPPPLPPPPATPRPAPTEVVPAPEPAAPAPPPADVVPRRVYGVRRVLARGIGVGSADEPGLIVKPGNTVDGRADSLTATAADLVPTPPTASTAVDRAPIPVERPRPHYSETLRRARAEGTVTARLLVGADGAVDSVVVVSDIGHDSAALATRAFRAFRFQPALRDGIPVAVWIVHRIRFEFEE
jgi:protein TonB